MPEPPYASLTGGNAGAARGVLPVIGELQCVAPRMRGNRVGWRRMRIEIYRVVYWVGIAALVVWTVYSAYSAFTLS
jgi:hypothetical protein